MVYRIVLEEYMDMAIPMIIGFVIGCALALPFGILIGKEKERTTRRIEK